MGKYIVRRLLQMIPVIIGATFLIFIVVFALPGDPVQGRCGERPCPPSYVAAFRAEYNLDKPVVVQYLLYMGNVLQGDLGKTFYGNSVSHDSRRSNARLRKHRHCRSDYRKTRRRWIDARTRSCAR